MLDTYTYQGTIGFMTFTGVVQHPIAFNLILAPWVDPEERDTAARAIASFLIDEAMKKLEGDANIEEDVD